MLCVIVVMMLPNVAMCVVVVMVLMLSNEEVMVAYAVQPFLQPNHYRLPSLTLLILARV